MFDLGWTEMVLIGVVALIVVGPKELPNLFRSMGQFVGKARGMAREFTRAMEAAADETGVKEIDKTIRAATRPLSYAGDRLRETALGTGKPASAAKIPAAGTPLAPAAGAAATPAGGAAAAAASPATAPGPATQALSADREKQRAEALAAAAERRAAEAERRAADAERRAAEFERRVAAARAAASETDTTP